MEGPAKSGVEAWHAHVRDVKEETLDALLADDVVFLSPVVHTPQKGKAVTKLYLMAAFNVFPGEDAKEGRAGEGGEKTSGKFRYVREVVGTHDAVLEFETEVDGIFVNGVDMITWNDEGRIIEFKVMIRPLKAIQKIHANMAAMLEKLK
ncbi:MAG: nuclear transport factor 2 family protein [bacterium]|nr:nuclear transport factor 2 family protein [bacterium]